MWSSGISGVQVVTVGFLSLVRKRSLCFNNHSKEEADGFNGKACVLLGGNPSAIILDKLESIV